MNRLTPLALIALLAVAVPAQAIYMVTDLEVFADRSSVNVGDEVGFTVGPANESVVAKYAGRTFRIVFTTDAPDGGDTVEGEAGNVTLDDAARGTFSWTVPAEADDRNVFLSLMDGEETAGSANVAVGDAPPMLMAAGGEPIDDGAPGADGGAAVGEGTPGEADKKPAPGFTALAILAAAAFVVLVLLPRRRDG